MTSMFRIPVALAVLAGATFAMQAHATGEVLNGEAIRNLITGRTVYLAAPLGGEFPLSYSRNGSVNGNGTAVGLGRFYAARETGRWFMNGDALCQQFPTWYQGQRLCFTVQKLGPDRIRWVRDNGESGIARVAD